MTTTFETLYTILENADYSPRSYSGRGMFGRQCIGVTCDNEFSMLMKVVHGLLEEYEDDEEGVVKVREALEEIGNPSTDSMGRSIIVYWPHVAWETEDAEDEDEDED